MDKQLEFITTPPTVSLYYNAQEIQASEIIVYDLSVLPKIEWNGHHFTQFANEVYHDSYYAHFVVPLQRPVRLMLPDFFTHLGYFYGNNLVFHYYVEDVCRNITHLYHRTLGCLEFEYPVVCVTNYEFMLLPHKTLCFEDKTIFDLYALKPNFGPPKYCRSHDRLKKC